MDNHCWIFSYYINFSEHIVWMIYVDGFIILSVGGISSVFSIGKYAMAILMLSVGENVLLVRVESIFLRLWFVSVLLCFFSSVWILFSFGFFLLEVWVFVVVIVVVEIVAIFVVMMFFLFMCLFLYEMGFKLS